jgi:hypothetical protein
MADDKPEYHAPTVTDEGTLVELTRAGGNSDQFDGAGYNPHSTPTPTS